MNREKIESLAKSLIQGEIDTRQFTEMLSQVIAEPAAEVLQMGRSAHLEAATLDLDRRRRCGFPEVVYGEGKSLDMLKRIFQTLVNESIDVLATRIDHEKGRALCDAFPAGRYNSLGRVFRIPLQGAKKKPSTSAGWVALVTAGSSDLPVAEEARETLDWMGVRTTVIHDVGVAGPHRLVERLDQIVGADAVVVVAGMEGALPSVVGGHVDCPVIATPTSVGYGASFGGVSALLGMLNSCAANVAVVNIDAGFKAAYLAGMIARRKQTPQE